MRGIERLIVVSGFQTADKPSTYDNVVVVNLGKTVKSTTMRVSASR